MLPTRLTQALQAAVGKRIISQVLETKAAFSAPLPLRIVDRMPIS